MCHVGTLTTVKYKSASINTIFLQEKVINRSPWYELLVISDNVENRSTLATIQSPSSVILVLLHTHTIFLLYFLPTYLPGSIPQSSPPDTGKYLLLDHSAHYQNIDTAERTWHHMSPSDRLKNQETDFGDYWIQTEVCMFNWEQNITEKRGQMVIWRTPSSHLSPVLPFGQIHLPLTGWQRTPG